MMKTRKPHYRYLRCSRGDAGKYDAAEAVRRASQDPKSLTRFCLETGATIIDAKHFTIRIGRGSTLVVARRVPRG